MGKQLKIRYKHTFSNLLSEGETNTLPSETIAGESYTIRELFQRHARGLDIVGNSPNDAVYDEDVTHNSTDRNKYTQLDLVEQSELADLNKINIENLTEIRKQKVEEHNNNQKLEKIVESEKKAKTKELEQNAVDAKKHRASQKSVQ